MSYILDALKKSDQQRRRGEVPTLQVAPALGPRRPPLLPYGLAGAALIVVGVAIGWFRPWQPEPTLVAAVAPTPLPDAPKPVQPELTRREPPPAAAAATAAPLPAPQPPASARLETSIAPPVARSDLPASIQQELPPLSVAMHVYSSQPRDRLVSVDNRLLREGDYLQPDLRLEEIMATGMVFSYRGYRFQRGVQ